MGNVRPLTFKQQQFVELFNGNGTDTARRAGYSGSEDALGKTAYDLLRNPKIRKLIDARTQKKTSNIIATREERQSFWTETMKNPSVDMRDRLKASELLGKSQADFTESIDHRVAFVDIKELLPKARESRGLGL
jgi:phage terminase small subunit